MATFPDATSTPCSGIVGTSKPWSSTSRIAASMRVMANRMTGFVSLASLFPTFMPSGSRMLLRMPVLVELSILFEPDTAEIYINDTEDEFARLVRGHAASNSTLRSLTIQGGFLAKDTLYNVLRNLTALTELTLDNVEFPRDVFSKLYAPVACLPELNTLKLPNLWVDVDKLLRLSEFLEERHAVLETSRGYWVGSSDSED
ncbi:hypothetical protein FA13DRAFT_820653 [Coprinellus micaceus]|uniref:F-box domain-containing protein n=1 Tax=Coprinellus micaceus TaxID=71717 RepID=A0A4Y7S429_COPMI|nr:hypothetical protein FA13DRAFT_820653 [Coprinellus micaceus]